MGVSVDMSASHSVSASLPRLLRQRLSALMLATSLGLAAPVAMAQSLPPPDIGGRSWFLFDVSTNTVLYSQAPDERVEPASLTKLMTAYVVFEALRDGTLNMDTRPPVSQAAYKAIGSRMFVDPRKPATVDELLHGLIIQSGNDAAIILAEAVSGSEEAFAQQMNAEARRIGMKNSHFVNASGLPAPEHHSTARDMALLATRIIKEFPDYYRMYSEKEYTFNGVRQPNRNRLLYIDPSVDGMKTGHTDAAGYCLVASAHREQRNAADPNGGPFSRRLLSVLMGAQLRLPELRGPAALPEEPARRPAPAGLEGPAGHRGGRFRRRCADHRPPRADRQHQGRDRAHRAPGGPHPRRPAHWHPAHPAG